MFNWQSARESNQKDEIAELTRKAQMEALRGKNATKYIADANANYWDYAGKVGAGGAAQQIATNAEPYLSALKNQGMMGTAGIKGEYDLAAADVTGQSRLGAAEIAGNATMGAAGQAAGATRYSADQNRAGRENVAMTEAQAKQTVAELEQKGKMAQLTATERGLLERARAELASRERVAAMGAASNLGAAQIRADTPRYNALGELISGRKPAGAGASGGPQIGQRKTMSDGTLAEWDGTAWVEVTK